MKVGFKLGLDIHGVLDREPGKFIKLATIIRNCNGLVIICTGASVRIATEQLNTISREFNPYHPVPFWDSIFSITDYLISKGIPHTPTDDGGIRVESELWDKAKGDWALENNIDLHIDDSPEYGKYFPDGVYLKFNDRKDRIDFDEFSEHNKNFNNNLVMSSYSKPIETY